MAKSLKANKKESIGEKPAWENKHPRTPKKNNIEHLLLTDVSELIEESRQYVAQTVNTTLSLLYWKIGRRINTEVLKNKRAEYGKQIIGSLSKQLIEKYGKGWDEKTLRHYLRVAETFSEELYPQGLGPNDNYKWY